MVPFQIKLKIRDCNINCPRTDHIRLTRVSGCKSRIYRARNVRIVRSDRSALLLKI